MSREWYPLLFSPIYREAEWGSTLLRDHLGRDIPHSELAIGESYEIIDQGEIQSVVENGTFAGTSIHELISEAPEAMVAVRHGSASPLPLTIKYIDTGVQRPLQVHPDGATCNRIPGARPNTKMWYIVNAWENARLTVGIKRRCTQQQFRSRIGTPEMENLVQTFPSEPGDAYFVMAGRVHALDAGNLVFSVEQNSITEFELCDLTGGCSIDSETLELALECINFQDRTLARIRGEASVVKRNRKIPLIINCPYFTVDEWRLAQELHDHTDGSSFHVITPIDSSVVLVHNDVSLEVQAGRSCFLPAAMGYYSVVPREAPAKVLRTALRTV